MILTGGGVKAIKGVGLITLMSGLSFSIPQILVAKICWSRVTSKLLAQFVVFLTTVLMAKLYHHQDNDIKENIEKHSAIEILRASSPFILVFVFVVLASSLFPNIQHLLGKVTSYIKVYTGKDTELFKINWLSSPGTLILASYFYWWINSKS